MKNTIVHHHLKKKKKATISSCTDTNENHLANLPGPTLDPSGHNEDNEEPQLPINDDEDEKGQQAI